MWHEAEEVEDAPCSGAGPKNKVPHSSCFDKDDIMPSSLSQVDSSVLRQLPEDLKADILEQLPAHRRQEFCSNPAAGPNKENLQESLIIEISHNYPGSSGAVLNDNLWVGNPPYWVDKFKGTNCLFLKKLAEIYCKSGFTSSLSSVLLQTIYEYRHLGLPLHCSDETINIMSELLKQYIKGKIERDIEEIYICCRFLKRYVNK